MSAVFISIGSNLGDRKANCMGALDRIKEAGIEIKKISSTYETKPWGVAEQPDFINIAAEIITTIQPIELLNIFKNIEAVMGRKEGIKWGPRIIDIDIIFYDDIIFDSPELKIPHPLLHKRDFVLRPMSEIAPNKKHPLMNKTVKELSEEINNA
jgi:2-amino-4-hydroxy-6-hydroxymethyldihydropteridine diphosphokinase